MGRKQKWILTDYTQEKVKKEKKKMKRITEHRPKHYKYAGKEFGNYLAGLIDGDGHINKLGYIIIVFHENDIQLAYWLKKEIGYGHVRRIKDKKGYTYILSNMLGIRKVANLIKDKLCLETKVKQFNENLTTKIEGLGKTKKSRVSLNNSWLSGFIDADGSFRIYILNREKREEIRLLLQIDQKNKELLEEIKGIFGGYLGYREKQETYYYSTVSYKNIRKVVLYIDRYPLQSRTKILGYIRLRKSYLLVQEGKHLEKAGMIKIRKYKEKTFKI